jgi:hypothetical protein
MDIESIINKSDWADSTKASRLKILQHIKKVLNIESKSWEFLKDFKLINKYIDTIENPNTAKSKLLTIKNVLNLFDKRAAAKYEMIANDLNDKVEEWKGNNTATSDDILSIKEIMEIPYRIEDDIKFLFDKLFLNASEIDKLKKNKFKYIKLLTDFIISILYCWQAPIRCEWGIMQLSKSDTKNNYNSRTKIVSFNDFKNVKSFGKRSWKLDSNISNYIDEYLDVLDIYISKPSRLLYHWDLKGNYKEFTRASFSSYLYNTLSKYANKDVTINKLRHSYETAVINNKNYNKMTINEKKQIHERLLHRVATAQEYHLVET